MTVVWEPGGDVIHYQDGNNRDGPAALHASHTEER
jgi:hypothetical protein